MSILSTIESFEYDKNREWYFGRKSAIVWGRFMNEQFPLFYITKPKNISEDDFNEILDCLDITIKRNHDTKRV